MFVQGHCQLISRENNHWHDHYPILIMCKHQQGWFVFHATGMLSRHRRTASEVSNYHSIRSNTLLSGKNRSREKSGFCSESQRWKTFAPRRWPWIKKMNRSQVSRYWRTDGSQDEGLLVSTNWIRCFNRFSRGSPCRIQSIGVSFLSRSRVG